MPTRDEAIACIRNSSVAAFTERIVAALSPSVLLHRDPTSAALPVGASRMGGDPDLPAGFPWPSWEIQKTRGFLRRRVERRVVPLDFLAQIRCDELPADSVPAAFPRNGMLWVFFDAKELPLDADGARLIHLPEPGPLSRTAAPHAGERPAFQPCRLRPVAAWTLPQDPIPIDTEDRSLIESYFEEVCTGVNGDPTGVVHRMFGHAQWIQGAEVGIPARRLILQIDSDDHETGPGWMWGDAGRIYFTMTDQQLSEQRFAEALWTVQCY